MTDNTDIVKAAREAVAKTMPLIVITPGTRQPERQELIRALIYLTGELGTLAARIEARQMAENPPRDIDPDVQAALDRLAEALHDHGDSISMVRAALTSGEPDEAETADGWFCEAVNVHLVRLHSQHPVDQARIERILADSQTVCDALRAMDGPVTA